eukprot:15454267-Alexandrium_andersonii.AAC.1
MAGYSDLHSTAFRMAQDQQLLATAKEALWGAFYARNSHSPRTQRASLLADVAAAIAPERGPFFLAPDLVFKVAAVLVVVGYRPAAI